MKIYKNRWAIENVYKHHYTALMCGSCSKKALKKSTYAVMIRIIIAFANQISLYLT